MKTARCDEYLAINAEDKNVSSKSKEFRNISLDSKIRAGMQDMRLIGQFTDIILVARNVEFKAHKLVLANSSEYFRAMFSDNFNDNNITKVLIEDIEAEILELLIQYIYTSKILITEDNVQSLLAATKMLLLTEVIDVCCEFLVNQLDPTNCLGIKTILKWFDCHKFVSICDSYIHEHFSEVVKYEEFYNLNPEDLILLLSSDLITPPSEEFVFESVLSWINNDKGSHSQYYPDIMNNVQFTSISSDYLINRVSNEPIIKEYNICKDVVTNILCDRRLKAKKNSSTTSEIGNIKCRQYLANAILAIGGLGKRSKALRSVEYYDYKDNQWRYLSEMTDRRNYCGVAVVRGKVCVIGGVMNGDTMNTVNVYDPSRNAWSYSLPNMQSARCSMGVASLNNRIYAVGGLSRQIGGEFKVLNLAEVLDLTEEGTKGWKSIKAMNTGRSSVGVGVLQGKLYAVGGCNGKEGLSTVEVYDPEQDVWSPVTNMTFARGGTGVGVLDGSLYCVGGWNTVSRTMKSVEKYSPDTNTWSLVAEINQSRAGAGVFSHQGRLYVVGGTGQDGGPLSSMEMYNPQTDTWMMMGAMNTKRMYLSVGPAYIDSQRKTTEKIATCTPSTRPSKRYRH